MAPRPFENALRAAGRQAPPAIQEGLEAPVTAAVDRIDALALELAGALESPTMPLQVAYDALLTEFIRRAKERTPTAVLEADGRNAKWRARVRLYAPGRLDEPEADSDPELAADRAGETVLYGLPAVGAYLRELAQGFHGCPLGGLDDKTLRHRLKSLRPTLSRRGGDAVWRVPYMAPDGEWLARVDVERAI